MKDIKWVRREVAKLFPGNVEAYVNQSDKTKNQLRVLNKVQSILDQLEEPEVLSQEWIDDESMSVIDTFNRHVIAVPVDRLQNLLVPKQELPVIPKFVADYIQEGKDLGCDLGTAMTVQTEMLKGIRDYIKNNEETFARAWLDGYEVEAKQRYRVIFPSVDENGKGFNYLAKDDYHKELWVEDTRTDGLAWDERSSFTEDEIRDLDKGDILFEHFAKPVEELEE